MKYFQWSLVWTRVAFNVKGLLEFVVKLMVVLRAAFKD